MIINNLLRDLPAPGPEEDLVSLLERPGVRIERIVSHGHASPTGFWYDQEEDEWVALLAGRARLEIEDTESKGSAAKMIEMNPGDWLLIPAHRRHRVAWTCADQPTIWLAVFTTADPAAPAGSRGS